MMQAGESEVSEDDGEDRDASANFGEGAETEDTQLLSEGKHEVRSVCLCAIVEGGAHNTMLGVF